MPWRKKTKAGTWKPVRVQHAWLDKIREAHKKNPSFSPNCDLATTSDPNVINVACQIASVMISGLFWEKLTPDIDRIVDIARLDAATRVAAHFGGKVVTNADGSLTVIEPGQDHISTVPAPVPFQRPAMFH